MENTPKNVFITGKAGTGKSTLLNYFRNITKKKVIVLAPTGVAALNVKGETIHSFFGFKPDITQKKIKKLSAKRARIFKEIEAIIIDEISMVRSDLLDCVDKHLRLNAKCKDVPFGGIQMIFIGDLYQLPPVVTRGETGIFRSGYKSQYFFDAQVFEEFSMEFIELEKIYRQKDEAFIGLLNAIRNNSITEEGMAILNKRVGVNLENKDKSVYAVHLTVTNKMASEINNRCLETLKGKIFTYSAEIDGAFKESSYPTDSELKLGIGAQVMLLNNDSLDRWVNGSIGRVVDIRHNKESGADSVFVRLTDGNIEEVLPFSWDIFHFSFNEGIGAIESETVGSFTQYPLRLAWALTIHKSQGKTFEQVFIDLGNGAFAHGQTYVALSRCVSFEGISLARPIKKSDVLMDFRIVKFLTNHQYGISERNMPFEDKLSMIKDAIENNSCLEILYLKSNDEKSRRVIRPFSVGERAYQNKPFVGVEAHCLQRGEERMFRVDRILEMKAV